MKKDEIMKVISTNCLDDKQRLATEKLIKEVQVFDGTHRTPYLSNSLNFDEKMPAFFLGYEDRCLVALLTVYADCQEAELAILVHPNHRRKGYAKALWCEFDEIRRDYQLRPIIMTEKCFLDKNPDLIRHLGMVLKMVLEPDFEYWLTREREPYPLEERADLTVLEASAAHIEAIADFQMKAFKESKEQALHYAKGALEDENGKLYIVMRGDRVLSSCTVDFSTDYNYFYGFAVVEDCRGQGIGTYFMKRLVNQLIAENEKAFQIAVESANIAAKSLYEKLGFKEQTQVFYVKKA
ncbi:GNAT family N-acetyltransferase [Streptococcus gallolyticus]|uniref:GNAT family N-acetyltransferase n=1 Tax=Streptococcus gallolyticus TaxID=315405 RepID=UPI003523241C